MRKKSAILAICVSLMMVFAMIPAGAGTLYADAADGVKYTITFQDEDGNVLQTSEVEEGVRPVYTGDQPGKAADDTYLYLYRGWKDTYGTSYSNTEELPPATEKMTYTATFYQYEKDPQGALEASIYGMNETLEYDGEKHPMPFQVTYLNKATGIHYTSVVGIDIKPKKKHGDINLWNADVGNYEVNLRSNYLDCFGATADMMWVEVMNVVEPKSSLTIAPAPLTITAKDQTYTYNGEIQGEGDTTYADPEQISQKVTVEGLKGGDYVYSVILDGQDTAVGVYKDAVTAGNAVIYSKDGKDVTGNYTITYKAGTLTIEEPAVSQYTVTFVDGQGKTLKTQKVESGKAATAPADPKRSGYTFAGWDKDFSKVTSDMTVTAKWNKVPAPAVKVSGMLLAKMTAKGKSSLEFTWSKVDGAQGYDIFLSRCNHNGKVQKLSKVMTIKGNQTLTWTKKKLTKKASYKAVVKAYVMKNGKKTYVRTSPMVHVYTSGGTKNYTNAKSVTVKKTKVTLKKGKTYKIKASVKKLKKSKKLMPATHEPKLRYISSNKKIATVSKSGKITAKSKGSCKVYAIAVNGARKAVRVTVK